MKWLVLLVLLVIFLPSVFSAPPEQSCDCGEEINSLQMNLSVLNQDLANLSEELRYYKNLSEYYKQLYESKEINVTNRELISIYNILNQNFTDFSTRIGKIEDSLTIFSLEIGLSIVGGVALIELIFFYFRRKKK